MSQIQILCPKHSEQIEYFCMNNSCSEYRLFCFSCVKNNIHSTHQRDWEKMSLLKEKFLVPQSKDWLEIVDSLEMLQEQINRFVNKLKDILIEKFVLSLDKLREMSANKMNDFVSILFKCQIEKQSILDTILQNTQNLIESLNSFIQDNQLQQNESQIIDKNAHTIYINQLNDYTIQINQQNASTININQQYNQYELIKSNKDEECLAICFNQDSSLMVAGYKNNKIKIFQFKSGYFKETYQFTDHKSDVLCLQFMKKQISFVSGSADKCIIIWVQDNNKLWYIQQKLSGHKEEISCLLVNNNEDLIITGSADKTIRFWIKDKTWKHSFTLTQHKGFIRSISLNQNENQLISCALDDNQILVSRKQINNEWKVIQIIEKGAQRLCFINNNLFAVQEKLANQMVFYELNKFNHKFIEKNKVQVKSGDHCESLFPQQYISQKQIIVSKNGYNINIIKVNQNFELELLQNINFNTQEIYGAVTNDGQFLVTWDQQSQQMQVRIYR